MLHTPECYEKHIHSVVKDMNQPFGQGYPELFHHPLMQRTQKNEQKILKMVKKVFLPVFGCAQHLNTGQNTQNVTII